VTRPPPSAGTWAILQRDGANREVAPYLSSLGGGELGTGTIRSPEFPVSTASIAFTVCGHDGQEGGQGENLVALVDARTGAVLRSTPAPGADPMQERSWDVADLMGRSVRIEVRDGIAAGGFAWIGIGRIDAGERGSVDFAKGLPDGWVCRQSERKFENLGRNPRIVELYRHDKNRRRVKAVKEKIVMCAVAAKMARTGFALLRENRTYNEHHEHHECLEDREQKTQKPS